VLIQVIMVGLIIFFPGIVSSGLDKKEVYDLDKIRIQMESQMRNLDALDAAAPPPAPGEPPASQSDVQEDPLKAAQEAIQGEKK